MAFRPQISTVSMCDSLSESAPVPKVLTDIEVGSATPWHRNLHFIVVPILPRTMFCNGRRRQRSDPPLMGLPEKARHRDGLPP